MSADALRILISQSSTEPQRLDAGRFTLLAVQQDLVLAADRREFNRQYSFAQRFARNRLFKSGMGRQLPGDLDQASRDSVQDFCMRVKEAEFRASETMPLGAVPLPDLMEHAAMLNRRYEGVDTVRPAAGDDDGRNSPGPYVLSALKELSVRALTSNPTSFSEQARPWTPAKVEAVVGQALHRLSGYGYTVFLHCCISAVRLAERHAADTYDDVAHHEQAHLHHQRATSTVMSPHMRAVVTRACADGHEEVMAEWAADGKHVRNLPFLDALIRVLPQLLDAPDEKPYALARRLLEAQKKYSDPEIHRGLTAATRHPIYQRVCKRILRGDQWNH